jgi:hypothetical protein
MNTTQSSAVLRDRVPHMNRLQQAIERDDLNVIQVRMNGKLTPGISSLSYALMNIVQ